MAGIEFALAKDDYRIIRSARTGLGFSGY